MDLRRKHNRMSGIVTVGAVGLAVAVLGISALFASRRPADERPDAPADLPQQTDVTIYEGPMEGFSATDARHGPDILGYRLNPAPRFVGGEGNVFIENPVENDYDMLVDYELPNGDILYQSPMLAPGEYVSNGYLEEELGSGVYDVTARLYAVDPEESVIVGVVEVPIQVTVEG